MISTEESKIRFTFLENILTASVVEDLIVETLNKLESVNDSS